MSPKGTLQVTQEDLFVPSWKADLEERAAQYKAEIRAMAEHARRCIGQRTRRHQELIGTTRARAISAVMRCG